MLQNYQYRKYEASTLWLAICMLNQKDIGSQFGAHRRDVQWAQWVHGDTSFERGSTACPVSSWQIWKVFSCLICYKMRTSDSTAKAPIDRTLLCVIMNMVQVFTNTSGWVNILMHSVFSSVGSFESSRKNFLLQLISSNLRGAEEPHLMN